MNQVWKSDLPQVRKMVMLALADQANDSGECYPSISVIAQRCSMGVRTVFEVLADLEQWGCLTKVARAGRSTVYTVTDPCAWRTPAPAAPLRMAHTTPARGAPPPLRQPHTTPAPRAPITTKEPPIEPPRNQAASRKGKSAGGVSLPGWLPADLWAEWVEYRKGSKGKWTAKAEELSLRTLERLRAAGHDPRVVIELAIERGWTGLFAPRADTATTGRPTLPADLPSPASQRRLV